MPRSSEQREQIQTMKKIKQLTEKTPAELRQHLDDAKKELFEMRVRQVSGQMENPLRIRTTRRFIARIKTVMNQTAKAER